MTNDLKNIHKILEDHDKKQKYFYKNSYKDDQDKIIKINSKFNREIAINKIKQYRRTISSIKSGRGTKKVVGFITPKQQWYIGILRAKIAKLKENL